MIPSWYAVEDASKILGLSKATLWNLKNIGSLEAGKHWLYVTGKKNSNVRFNVEAILQWRRHLEVLGPFRRAQFVVGRR